MKKLFITLAIIGITTIQADAFDWTSALNFLNRASEPKTEETQISTLSDLEKQMTAIDSSVQTAFIDIVSKLSGWNETRKVKSQIKSGDIATVISNYANTYFENNKQNIMNKIKKMSDKDKTALANNIKTLTECGQNYLLIAANGAKAASNTLKTAQNLSEVSASITKINNMASELRNRATAVISAVNKIKSVASTSGLTIK